MRRILWSLAPALVAASAMLIAPMSAIAGPGLPEEEEKKPARRDDDDSSTTTTLLTPTPIAATGAIVRTEVRRLRTAEVAPKDVLLYANVPDSTRLLEGYRGSAIAKIVGLDTLHRDIEVTLKALRTGARVSTRRGLPGFLRVRAMR